MEVKGLHIGGVSLAQQNSPKPVAAKPKEETQDAVKIRLSRAAPTSSSAPSNAAVVSGGGNVSVSEGGNVDN